MPDTILFHPVTLDKRQSDQLAAATAHEGYLLLKDVITAHAIKLQVEAMNVGVYAKTNPDAKAKAEMIGEQAALYARALDVLDEIEKKPDQWFKAELKPGR